MPRSKTNNFRPKIDANKLRSALDDVTNNNLGNELGRNLM